MSQGTYGATYTNSQRADPQSILADITNIAKSGPNPNEHLSESAVMQTLRKGIKDRVSFLSLRLGSCNF